MASAANLKVLVVDDQQSMRGLMKYCLGENGINKVTEAKNGKDAIDKLQFDHFDLIISDWNMDEVDGLTLLKVVRKHPKTAKTPFIMATGQKDQEQVQLAIKNGVNNYIVKPFNAATMRQRIEQVFGAL